MTPAQECSGDKDRVYNCRDGHGRQRRRRNEQRNQIRSALKAAGVDEDRLNALGITVEGIANGSIGKNDTGRNGNFAEYSGWH